MKNTIALITPAPISHRTAEENLGIGYLSKILRDAGYRVCVIDGWLEGLTSNQIIERIKSISDQLVFIGISCYRSNIEKAIELVKAIKTIDFTIQIVAGGYGPTFNTADFLNAGFDIVVIGEAENTIINLANFFIGNNLMLENIKGIAFKVKNEIFYTPKADLINDIDSLPFPDRDTILFAKERKCAINILSSRGCQANCIFCSIIAFQKKSVGNKWRQRSIKNFVDEIEQLNKLGVTHLKVIDDSFIEFPRDSVWCKELGDEIEARKLKVFLRGSIRADRVNDEILSHLKRAGFYSFSCGIENGSKKALKRMGKSAKIQDNLSAIKLFKKHGIYMQAGLILFDPKTTYDELYENYFFLKAHPWIITKGIFTEMYAAEGTPFYEMIKNANNLNNKIDILGNHQYFIEDKKAYTIYLILKKWHKKICKIYDKAIDPISCPKAITEKECVKFYNIFLLLNEINLSFFKVVLDSIKDNEFGQNEIDSIVDRNIDINRPDLEYIDLSLENLYFETGLLYEAELNPFIN